MNNSPISLMIVDDHQLFIDGLKAILRLSIDIEVVAEALNGNDALLILRNISPDVVITDINMPGMKGDELAMKIREQKPNVKVIALSMHNDMANIDRMVQAGVKGYILKNTGREELFKAIQTVHEGENYYSQEIKDQMLNQYVVKTVQPTKHVDSRFENTIFLSKREKQIIRMVIQSKSSQEIAEELGLSAHTVNTHRKNINSKLNINNTLQLAELVNKGLVDL